MEAAASPIIGLDAPGKQSGVNESNRLRHPRAELLKLIRGKGMHCYKATNSGSHADLTAFRDIQVVRRFSKCLGLPVPEIWKLYRSGLAPELAMIDHGPRPQLMIRGSLIDSIAKMARRETAANGIGLVSCRFALDLSLSGCWSTIVRAILDGRLTVWRRAKSGRGLLADLYVDDCSKLRAIVAQNGAATEFRHAPLNHAEVSMIIDRARYIASNIVHSDLMVGIPTVEKLSELRKSWAFSFELQTLAAMADRVPGGLYWELQKGGVTQMMSGPVSFWRRDEALSCLGLTPSTYS